MMKRTLLEECPLCSDNLQCTVFVGMLGACCSHHDAVTDVTIQWGTGEPPAAPPTFISESFEPVCPSCSEDLDCKVLVAYACCVDPDDVEIQLFVDLEEEDAYKCSNCSIETSSLYGTLCRACAVQAFDSDVEG